MHLCKQDPRKGISIPDALCYFQFKLRQAALKFVFLFQCLISSI